MYMYMRIIQLFIRNEYTMSGSKFVRTEHRSESDLEPFDTGSSRTGTLMHARYHCMLTSHVFPFRSTSLVILCPYMSFLSSGTVVVPIKRFLTEQLYM